LERSPHIDFRGPGRIYSADGMTLFDVKECSFENMATTPGPGPAGDVRFPSFLQPIELSMEVKADRRLLAALLIGWRAKGHPRWIQTKRAMKMTRTKKRRQRAEVY